MNPEYQAMVERHKREREALRVKQQKELVDMKIRQEQERSKFKQARYVKNLNEWIEENRKAQGLLTEK